MLKSIDDNFNLHTSRIPEMTVGMAVTCLPGITYVDSGLSCDTFNIIHITDGLRLSESDFVSAVKHFRSKQFAFCIWISRENLTARVIEFFERESVRQQNQEPGMVLDLTAYEPQQTISENMVVVQNESQLKDFAEVIALNWSPPDEHVRRYYALTAEQYLDPANRVTLAIYYDRGKPVSVLEMFASDEKTLGLYALATLAEYRGKGIGSTVMKFALNKAKADGYEKVILQASEVGLGIYRKLGFSVHTQYYEYA
jgi:GNAT superfamily N-acetyltransferase